MAQQGQPLTRELTFNLGNALHKRKKETQRRRGVLPKGLLYIDADQQRYIWIKPSHRAMIMFDSDCKVKDRVIIHPTLIFCCHGENLYVYASTTDEPTENTQLSRAPYLNVYDEENLCKGNINLAKVKRAETHQDLIDAWEDVFFKSRFSHGIGNRIPQKNNRLSNEQYIESLHKAKTFPYATLQKTNKTLKSLFK